MTTRWSETDRVVYCELHDSLVRQVDWRLTPETTQCDFARGWGIPRSVEKCDIKLAELRVIHD